MDPTHLLGYWWIVLLVGAIFCYKLVLRFFGVVIIPDNHLGKVNKKFKLLGRNKTLPDGVIIALNGEAGWQVDTLASGLHYWKWPWQYQIVLEPFRIIPKDKLGVRHLRQRRRLDE